MDTLNKFIAGAFGLIAIYLIVENANSAESVKQIFGGFSRVFATLQGRTVQ